MDKAIHFRSVVDTFDDAEFLTFETKLFASFNKRQLIVKSVFLTVLNQIKHGELDDIHQINGICKSILDSRCKETGQKIKPVGAPQPSTAIDCMLDKIPSSVISHTASYLKRPEISLLMLCSRYTFMSCSTPSTFLSCDLSEPSPAFCAAHRMATQVAIDACSLSSTYFGEAASNWNWRRLDRLTVDARMSNNLDLQYFEYLVHILRRSEVKQLVLNDLDLESDKSVRGLLEVLSAHTELEGVALRVYDNTEGLTLDHRDIQVRLKNLRGLALHNTARGASFCAGIVAALSTQLHSLHITESCRGRGMMSLSDGSTHFNNLQELCLTDVMYDVASNLLTSSCNFVRIHLEESRWRQISNLGRQLQAMSVTEQCALISSVVAGCHKLRHLALTIAFDRRVFEAIKESLTVKTTKWDSFRLRMALDGILDAEAVRYIGEDIVAIADSLRESVLTDFVFSLKIDTVNEAEAQGMVKTLSSERNGSLYKIEVTHCQGKSVCQTLILITNRHNDMCGYTEEWMFQCQSCEDSLCCVLG